MKIVCILFSWEKNHSASQKKLFSHLWKHSFNLISGRKNVFHSWEEKKTPDIFSFFHVISQVEEKTKKLRKIFLKKCFIQYDVKKKILKNVSLKKIE